MSAFVAEGAAFSAFPLVQQMNVEPSVKISLLVEARRESLEVEVQPGLEDLGVRKEGHVGARSARRRLER